MPMNETVIYGVFLDNLWRNEKTGRSYFRMKTRQLLFLGKMYQSKEVIRNKKTGLDETWYTIVCDGSDIGIPSQKAGNPIKVSGYYMSDNQNSNSWDFKICKVSEATNDENVAIQYLSSDTFENVTEEDAIKIVATYGCDIYKLSKNPEAVKMLMDVTSMNEENARLVIDTIRKTTVEREVFSLLSQMDIPYPYSVKAVKYYGCKAYNKIRKRPYHVGERLGLTFIQCDAIAKHCGFNSISSDRIRMAAKEVIRDFEIDGNIFTPLTDFKKALLKKLKTESFHFQLPVASVIAMIGNEFGFERINGIDSVYRKALAEAEKRIAGNIERLAKCNKVEAYNDSLIEYAQKACDMKYGNQQRKAFSNILARRGVKILTGGPGTGKTTTVKGILLAYQKIHPDHVIKLCAPTGRAAQRMAESTRMPAVTIHRLLDYKPYGDNVSYKNADNPIEADLIVVDEMSMTDVELFDIFLEAVKTGTTLILVGDIHQLESVGPGAILNDLLTSDDSLIQKSMLTEVFRQKGDSPIIDNAQKINKGDIHLAECDEFKIIHTKSSEESLEQIKKLSAEMYDKDNPFMTQILCPARSGLAGIDNINRELPELLNPNRKALIYGYSKFREGDKIIMTKNNYITDYYNGDIGIVKTVSENGLNVEIRGTIIILTRDMLDDIKLSYGMTIHKSQGSEFKNVIVIMPMEPQNMLVRNLFYTAVTRAKSTVIIINESSAMETAIKVNKSGERRTLLKSYLPVPAA